MPYFFFLSGFVIGYKYLLNIENSTFSNKTFFINRFSRIYPIYLFALLVLCLEYIFVRNEKIDPTKFILNLTLTQSWIEEYVFSLNYPGWSLSVEAFLYLCFPFLIAPILKQSYVKAIILTILIWTTYQTFIFFLDVNNLFPALHFSTFLCGAILPKIIIDSGVKISNFKANIILVSSLMIFFIIMFFPNYRISKLYNGALAPLYSLIFVGILFSKNIITKILNLKLFQYLGKISYSIYILQHPCEIATNYINDISNHFFFTTTTGFFYWFIIALFVLSHLTYNYIEIPLQSYIRKKLN